MPSIGMQDKSICISYLLPNKNHLKMISFYYCFTFLGWLDGSCSLGWVHSEHIQLWLCVGWGLSLLILAGHAHLLGGRWLV